MHVERRRVDHEVGAGTDVTEEGSLARQPVEDATLPLKGMRTTAALEAAYQLVVSGLEEEHADVDAHTFDECECIVEIVEHLATAHVDDHSESVGHDILVDLGDGLGEQRRRQVVDDEPAQVFEGASGRGPSGPGHSGDEYEFEGVVVAH